MTVFLYCRVSSAGQEDNTSLNDQEERGRAFIKSQGWPDPIVLRDVASGRDLNRPELAAVRAHVHRGDRVVVLKLDRLSRSIVSGAPLIEEWTRAGVSLHSVSEPIETGSAMGRSMLRMILNFAETEREVIAERMASGKSRNADAGRFNGSPVPFGYRQGMEGEADFVPVPDQAAIVRELFRRFAKGGMGLTRLRRSTGCPLSEQAIREMLSNPIYIGRLRYAGTVRVNGHEPLVSEPLFNRVQKAKRLRSKGDPGRVSQVSEGEQETA